MYFAQERFLLPVAPAISEIPGAYSQLVIPAYIRGHENLYISPRGLLVKSESAILKAQLIEWPINNPIKLRPRFPHHLRFIYCEPTVRSEPATNCSSLRWCSQAVSTAQGSAYLIPFPPARKLFVVRLFCYDNSVNNRFINVRSMNPSQHWHRISFLRFRKLRLAHNFTSQL